MIPDLLLAPLAEITTPALRSIVRNFSSDVHIFSEMLSAASIVKGGFQNESRIQLLSNDPPFSYQLLGNDPVIMAEAINLLSEKGTVSFDINMGCAAPEVRMRGQGAALLADMKTASSIIAACRKATTSMLSVKIRGGLNNLDHAYIAGFAKMIEEEGADFITVHPRTIKQGYSRKADWSITASVVSAVNIPVIGNGDIENPNQAQHHKQESGCHGIMIGRKAVQSPWIFSSFFKQNDDYPPNKQVDLLQVSETFVSNVIEYIPEIFHKSRSHRFYTYFCKNFLFGHQLFSKIRTTSVPKLIHDYIAEYLKRNPSERFVPF